MKSSLFGKTVSVVTALAAINWGLVALYRFNFVTAIFPAEGSTRVIYALFGGMGCVLLLMTFGVGSRNCHHKHE